MSSVLNSTGSARALQNSSASTVLATFGPVAAYAAAGLVVFVLLRKLIPRLYMPRTFVDSLPPRERTPRPPKGLVNWVGAFINTPDVHVLNTQSLDGYMFLRLLKVSVICCIVGALITWPILLPINITGVGGQTQLNILTFSNVASELVLSSYYRYYAHTLCAYLYFGFIIYMITRESLYYITLRQAYLVSPLYANRISSRTVLFSSVPAEYLREDIIRQLLGDTIIRNVWIHRHITKVKEKVEERDKVAMMLEKAEIKLIKDANKARRKASKRGGDNTGEELKALRVESRPSSRRDSDASDTVASHWVKPTQRPTHRLKFLVGKKVDTIDWARQALRRLIPEVEALQSQHRQGKGEPHNSVFVEFESLRDAQSAYQSLTHHQPSRMAPRFTGIFPAEIIWSNLRIKWWERVIRSVFTTALVVGLVIAWTIPVSFISAISNAGYLSNVSGLSWLGFLYRLPTALEGLVTGLLPSILLSALMALLPVVLRFIARFSGVPTLSAVEYAVQESYFWFQVVQVFLVTTLAGGTIKTAEDIIHNPGHVVSVLAESLPASSNFYLSYITLQGLGVVTQTLLGLISLLVYGAWGKLMDHTPRAKYNRWISLNNPGLGTVYPIYTTLLIIAICYSCVAPLVLFFAAIGLYLFYIAYRYQFLYVYNVPYDTNGLMYARALQQLFVGLYLAELCLIGLFAIPLGKTRIVLGPFVMMIIFLVFTVIYHYALNRALRPLLAYLPKTLETEEQRLLAIEMSSTGDLDNTEYKGPDTLPQNPLVQRGNDFPRPDKANFFLKWLRPDLYADYYTLRQQVPRDFECIEYDEMLEKATYFHPSITAEPPLLWVPRDDAGVSAEECRETSKVLKMSDEGARLDENGNVIWDWEEAGHVPIAKKKIYW